MENIWNFIKVILRVMIILVINGFTFAKLWFWFIVPIFQIRPLNYIEALGLMVFFKFTLAKFDYPKEKNISWKSIGDNLDLVILWAGVTLLFGWLLSLLL